MFRIKMFLPDDKVPIEFVADSTLLNEHNFKDVGIEVSQLCVNVGFTKTKTEARKLIVNKGIRLNDKTLITDPFGRFGWVIHENKKVAVLVEHDHVLENEVRGEDPGSGHDRLTRSEH